MLATKVKFPIIPGCVAAFACARLLPAILFR